MGQGKVTPVEVVAVSGHCRDLDTVPLDCERTVLFRLGVETIRKEVSRPIIEDVSPVPRIDFSSKASVQSLEFDHIGMYFSPYLLIDKGKHLMDIENLYWKVTITEIIGESSVSFDMNAG